MRTRTNSHPGDQRRNSSSLSQWDRGCASWLQCIGPLRKPLPMRSRLPARRIAVIVDESNLAFYQPLLEVSKERTDNSERHMAEWILRLGVSIFVLGFGCNVASILFVVDAKAIWSVLFRGSFQRRQDYSPRGWRLHRAGVLLSIAGILVIVCAMLMGAG
jgi:hypothetical protein